MTKSKNITDYYRDRASEYEQIYYREVPERRQEIADHCDFLEKLSENKSVLDLACGTGYWTEVLARKAKEVVASDIVTEMIEQAGLKEFRNPVEFILADLHNPPFLKNSFDLITLGFWLSHEPRQNYTELFKSIKTPLKTGGQVWMIDNNPPAEGASSDSTGSDEHGNNFKKRRLSNGEEFVILKNYFSEENLVEILSPAFQIKELIHKTYYWSVLLEPRQLPLS